MKITVLCSDSNHPVNAYLETWIQEARAFHDAELVRSKEDARGGDILFLISCAQILTARDRSRYAVTLVLHASDLPQGRGWSPHIWQIAEGAEEITLSLLEAEDTVDSGRIWRKRRIPVPKDALWDEINHRLFSAEIELMNFAIENFSTVEAMPQVETIEPSYYPRRNREHSRIDPEKSIAEQFDLLRVCDPQRFPAFFDLRGQRYVIKLEKANEL